MPWPAWLWPRLSPSGFLHQAFSSCKSLSAPIALAALAEQQLRLPAGSAVLLYEWALQIAKFSCYAAKSATTDKPTCEEE